MLNYVQILLLCILVRLVHWRCKLSIGFSDLQLNLTAGEELEIEYEVDGWFYVSNSYWIL